MAPRLVGFEGRGVSQGVLEAQGFPGKTVLGRSGVLITGPLIRPLSRVSQVIIGF